MDEKFQENLLEELFRHYPDFSREWINSPFMLDPQLPPRKEIEKNIAYLLEKRFIERRPPGSPNLRITAGGIDYWEQLKKGNGIK